MDNQKGFTLVELLVVVAIIGIVISVVISLNPDDKNKKYEFNEENNIESFH